MDNLGPLNLRNFTCVCLKACHFPYSKGSRTYYTYAACHSNCSIVNSCIAHFPVNQHFFHHIQKGNLKQNVLLQSSIPKDSLMLAATCGASTSWSLRMLDQIKINL